MNAKAAGFTLAEVMIVTLLSAVIMGSIYQMIVMQERSTRAQYAVTETQQNARTGLAVITSDLKEISATDGDILEADSISMTVRTLTKAGLVCQNILDQQIDVAVLGEAFVDQDSLLIFREGDVANVNDDVWVGRRVNLQAPVNVANCGGNNPMNALSWQRLTLTANPLLPGAGVNQGALVRGFAHTRYRITDNGEWGQLMRRVSSVATGWSAEETPVIDKLASTADGGVRFRYFNAAGNQIAYNTLGDAATRATIMRVQVKMRGKAVTQVQGGTGANRFQDSLVTTVYLRGNYRTQ